jgi:hypothetical protein
MRPRPASRHAVVATPRRGRPSKNEAAAPHAGTPYRSSCRRASTTRLEHRGKAGRHAPHPFAQLPPRNTQHPREALTPRHRTPNTGTPNTEHLRYRRLSLPLPHKSPLPGGRLQGATRRFAIGPRADPGPSHPLVEPGTGQVQGGGPDKHAHQPKQTPGKSSVPTVVRGPRIR